MSFRKELYKDMEKWRATNNKYMKKYYGRTANASNGGNPWTEEEIEIVLKHEKTDTELSKILKRSVRAIQICRSRNKKKWKEV